MQGVDGQVPYDIGRAGVAQAVRHQEVMDRTGHSDAGDVHVEAGLQRCGVHPGAPGRFEYCSQDRIMPARARQ